MAKQPILKKRQFDKMFPDEEAALNWLTRLLNPKGIECRKCGELTHHHRIKKRRCYSCVKCSTHYYPLAGTIFHKSTTPLRDWLFAFFIMSTTRMGVSAKQLQRSLGCTYKTAWRIFHKIRTILAENPGLMAGPVEADETYIGARKKGKPGRGASGKTIVAGITDREGERTTTSVVSNASANELTGFIAEAVEPGATVYTDEWFGYKRLKKMGFGHETCAHGQEEWVVGKAHTNTIEGFWSILKNGLKGAYRGRVLPKYIQTYIDEYAFRYNHRGDERAMFFAFMDRIRQR